MGYTCSSPRLPELPALRLQVRRRLARGYSTTMIRGLLLVLASLAPAELPGEAPTSPPTLARAGLAVPAHPLDAPTPSEVHSLISADRGAHALAGFWTAGAGYAVATHREWDPDERRLAAVAATATASLAKEAFDAWIQDESFSGGDLLADGLGAAAFLAIAALAER